MTNRSKRVLRLAIPRRSRRGGCAPTCAPACRVGEGIDRYPWAKMGVAWGGRSKCLGSVKLLRLGMKILARRTFVAPIRSPNQRLAKSRRGSSLVRPILTKAMPVEAFHLPDQRPAYSAFSAEAEADKRGGGASSPLSSRARFIMCACLHRIVILHSAATA